MKKILLITILFLVALSLSATNYYAKVNGNDTTGNGTFANPYRSLYKCSTVALNPSDSIIMGKGRFLHAVQADIAVGVQIRGVDSLQTIIICTYAFSVLPAGDFTKGSIRYYSSSITPGNQSISNLTLDGGWTPTSTNTTTATRGICVYRRGNVSITNVCIKNFWVCGVGFYHGYPFTKAAKVSGNSVSYSIIRNCGNGYPSTGPAGIGYEGAALIELYGQKDLTVSNCILKNNERTDRCSDIMARWDWCEGIKVYNCDFYKPEIQATTNLWNFAIETWNIEGGVEIYDNKFYGGYNVIDIGGGGDTAKNVRGNYAFSVNAYRNQFIRNTPLDASIGTNHAFYVEAVKQCSDVYMFDNYMYNIACALGIGSGDTRPNYKNRIYFYRNLAVNLQWQQDWTMPIVSISNTKGTESVWDSIFLLNNTFVGAVGKKISGINVFSIGTISNLHAKNNIFYNCYNGNLEGFVHLPNTYNSYTSGTRSNIFIDNNLAYNCGNSNNISYSGSITNLSNTNNLKVDPLFVSSTDYHLLSTSPAVNSGINVGLPYLSTAPDRGYVEYVFENPAVLGTVVLDIPYNLTSRTIIIYASSVLDGGGTITERGVVWDTSATPTTANNKLINGSGLGVYLNQINSLNPSTTYYMRAYSINEAGTAYSNEISYRTKYSSVSRSKNGKTFKSRGKTLKIW